MGVWGLDLELPPSKNRLYNCGNPRKGRTKDYDRFIWSVKEAVGQYPGLVESVQKYAYFRVMAWFRWPKRIRKRDAQNRITALCDALQEALGVDDCLFLRGGWDVEKDPNAPECRVSISGYRDDE